MLRCRVLLPKPIEYRTGAALPTEQEQTHDVRMLVILFFIRRFRRPFARVSL